MPSLRDSLLLLLAQSALRKWDKALREGTYICNQVVGFNRCISKLQSDIQDNLRALETELSKGKSSQKSEKVLTEIRDLTTFNQNMSFCMGKSMQHLADILFVQMGYLTLLRRDAYLDHLKQGIKPDTWCALRNSPLIWCAGPKRKSLNLKRNAVPPSPDRAMAGMAPGNKIGINLIRVDGTVARTQTDLLLLLKIQKSQHGAPLAEIVTGAGVEVPPLEVATPRLSREIIIKNDNYCVSFVPNQDP